jgi:hypothetical protein
MPALMLRIQLTGALGLVTSAAIAVTSCGDGVEQLGAEELVERGDQLCRQGQQRFAEIQTKPPANAAAALDQTDELLAVAKDELDRLRDLEPPDELQAAYEDYLDARSRAIAFFERGRVAAEERDADGYGAAQERVAAEAAKRERLAGNVGFEVCSQPSAGVASLRSPSG